MHITTEPEDDWVQPTPTETGQLEVESIINTFDQRYNPDQIPYAGNSPDEVIYGVRNKMIQGPLQKTDIIDKRVKSRLEYIMHYAPRYYKHIIDEEVRRRGGKPTSWRYKIPNILTLNLFKKQFAEREIARDFFTYEHIPGANYNTLLANLNTQIAAIGVIGGRTFVDSRGNAINLALPNPVNEFDVAPSPSGRPSHQTVIVRWNEDDFITIKKKLERANIWADFSNQAGAREFIHLKFRQSELKRIIDEEKAKLSADRFNPQRLKTWLDNDAMRLALRDDEFQKWVNDNIIPLGFRSMEELRTNAPDMYQQLLDQQNRAKERVKHDTIEQMLKNILIPKQLENIHTSLETRAMLAYLEAELDDPEEGPALREFIKSLSKEENTEKMDSRGLLYKVIERDLKLKGVTEETGLPQKTLYATNMIINKARHTEIYGATNKRIVNQSSPLVQRMRNIAGAILPQDWLPILSAKDVLQHVVDTDPDLALFHDITVFSTRSDLIKAMQRFGKVSPRKLREMQMKLAEFIKGIEVPTDKKSRRTIDLTQLEKIIAPTGKQIVPGKTYTLRSEEAPLIENMIHMLSLLESQIQTENFLKEIEDDETINPETDRAKLILKKLRDDTENDIQMDRAIKQAVKDHDALYRRRLLFEEQKKAYNEACEQVEGLPSEERIKELERLGMNARQRSKGIISLRTRRALKKAGKKLAKYGPHTWPFWVMAGVGIGGYKAIKAYLKLFKGEAYDKAKETEKMDWKAFARVPGNVIGSVYSIARRIVLWPFVKLDSKVRKGSENYYAKRSSDA